MANGTGQIQWRWRVVFVIWSTEGREAKMRLDGHQQLTETEETELSADCSQ